MEQLRNRIDVEPVSNENYPFKMDIKRSYTESNLGEGREHLFFCNHFEELQTVLFEVGLIINNAPNIRLPKHYRNMFNTQPFVIW